MFDECVRIWLKASTNMNDIESRITLVSGMKAEFHLSIDSFSLLVLCRFPCANL